MTSRGRRRIYCLLTPLLVLLGTLGLDRSIRWLWYLPSYSDTIPPNSLSGERPPNKDYIRFVPDRWLGWRYHAHTTIHTRMHSKLTGAAVHYDLSTNRWGFRGPDVAVPKPPRTIRIVAMGGSSTVGPGVKVEDTYVFRLARALRSRFPGRTVEAVNAGVDGYGSRQGFLLYSRDLRQLQPDLLIVAYDVNDAVQTYSSEQVKEWQHPSAKEMERIARQSAPADEPENTLRQLRQPPSSSMAGLRPYLYESGLFFTFTYVYRWLRDHLSPEEGEEEDGDVKWNVTLPLHCQTPKKLGALARPWDSAVLRYRNFLAALDRLAARDGVPLIYLSVPHSEMLDIGPPYPFDQVMKDLAEQRKDRAHVDPSGLFCDRAIEEVMLDKTHPTALGHGIIARALEAPAIKLLGEQP